MITIEFVTTLARYNAWQNRSLIAAADALNETARRQDRGAFFSSIHGTFSHLLWGDSVWMSRFSDVEKPAVGIKDSSAMVPDWDVFRVARAALDRHILAWADALAPEWLAADMTWFSSAANREFTRPRALLVAHFFNHQTHHRGQVHAMLTAAGKKPEATDLMLAPWLE